MKRLLAIHDRELAERIVGALVQKGIVPETTEEEDEAELSLWCVDVPEPDFEAGVEIVEREMAADWETKSRFRCERCYRAMQFKEDESRDPRIHEYVCPKCGDTQVIGVE